MTITLSPDLVTKALKRNASFLAFKKTRNPELARLQKEALALEQQVRQKESEIRKVRAEYEFELAQEKEKFNKEVRDAEAELERRLAPLKKEYARLVSEAHNNELAMQRFEAQGYR